MSNVRRSHGVHGVGVVEVVDCPVSLDEMMLTQLIHAWVRQNPFLSARRQAGARVQAAREVTAQSSEESLDRETPDGWCWRVGDVMPIEVWDAAPPHGFFSDVIALKDRYVFNIYLWQATQQLFLVCDDLFCDALSRRGLRDDLANWLTYGETVLKKTAIDWAGVSRRAPKKQLMFAEGHRRLRAAVKKGDAIRAAENWSDGLCQVIPEPPQASVAMLSPLNR